VKKTAARRKVKKIDKPKIKRAVKLIFEAIGDDPGRPGVKHTPERVAEMYEEIFEGMHIDPSKIIKVLRTENHDEIVLVKDVPVYSVCEHHLLPFIGKAHVAYLPGGNRIAGLSKIARVIEAHSKKPQLQERLTVEIAETIMQALKPRGVIVIIEAEHLCMTMRGVKKPGAKTVTSVVRGIFREKPATRAEGMALIYNT